MEKQIISTAYFMYICYITFLSDDNNNQEFPEAKILNLTGYFFSSVYHSNLENILYKNCLLKGN